MLLFIHSASSRRQILSVCCSALGYGERQYFASVCGGSPQNRDPPAHPVPPVLAWQVAEMWRVGHLRWTRLASTIAPSCRVMRCIHSLTSVSHKNICAHMPFAYICILVKSGPPASVCSQTRRFLLGSGKQGSQLHRREEDASTKAVLESPGDYITHALKSCYFKGDL